MTLQTLTWEEFRAYLLLERNFKDTNTALDSHKSRFIATQTWFSSRDFTRENFVELITNLTKAGKSAETLNKFISMARNIEKYLILNHSLSNKILDDFMYRTVGSKPAKQIITPEEITKIVNCDYPHKGYYKYFLNIRDKAMFMLASTIGCRSGELIKLKWTDLIDDGKRKFIVLRDTKSKRKSREVVVPAAVWKVVQVLPGWSEYVFCSYRKKQLKTKAVNEALQNRAKYLGITKPVTTHLLRHSLITQLLESGADWFAVSLIVGHADPKTTKGYLQKSKHIQEQALAKHPLNKTMLCHDDNEQILLEVLELINKDSSQVIVTRENNKLSIILSKL